MSLSQEDILSNDQLQQIHFDPRYRDYRSSTSLNNSGCNMYRERRSHSLINFGSGELRRPSCEHMRRGSGSGIRINVSPPPYDPAAQALKWETNPSIFVEEYFENPDDTIKINSVDERNIKNSSESVVTALSEDKIKSFGDLNDIPFIDEEDDLAPCRYYMDDEDIEPYDKSSKFTGIMINQNRRPSGHCRKSVSFDIISDNCIDAMDKIKLNKSNTYQIFNQNKDDFDPKPEPTIPLFEFSITSECEESGEKSKPEDHSILFDHLNKLKDIVPGKEFSNKKLKETKNDNKQHEEKSSVCRGKVKALTTYFNALKYLNDDICQSSPNLSSYNYGPPQEENDKLSKAEQKHVMQQLKEWSKFGLGNPQKEYHCNFLSRVKSTPVLTLNNDDFKACKYYNEVLNKIDRTDLRNHKHHSISNIDEYLTHDQLSKCHHHRYPHSFILHKQDLCLPKCRKLTHRGIPTRPPSRNDHNRQYTSTPMLSEKHRCRSPCFNPKSIKKLKQKQQLRHSNYIIRKDQKYCSSNENASAYGAFGSPFIT